MIEKKVKKIIKNVRKKGDIALKKYTKKFDKVNIESIQVPEYKIKKAYFEIKDKDEAFFEAVSYMVENLETFYKTQLNQINDFVIEKRKGVKLKQIINPLQNIAVYAPGGRYPLISSVLMGVVPAKIANIKNIALFTPPKNNKYILALAKLLDINKVYQIGGAQAIAAACYGTESIEKYDKIIGPGNKFVNIAKKICYPDIGIDFIAGPSEVLIYCSKECDYKKVAYDLLAQAEHDNDAKAIFVSDKPFFIETTKSFVKMIQAKYGTKLKNIEYKLIKSKNNIYKYINNFAPEHLEVILNDDELKDITNKLYNYGSIFIGENSCESFADYTAGINHTLPTNKCSKYRGGLSIFDFVKIQTCLEIENIFDGNLIETSSYIAGIENLFYHKKAINSRK